MEKSAQPSRIENELFDAKSLHKLLYDHQSEDFKKSRRNLMVITFIIISVGVLGIDLTKLNILGLKLSEIHNPGDIYWVGIILIVYWWIMFEIYRERDKNIHSLHRDIVIKKIGDLENEIPLLEEEYNKLPYSPSTSLPPTNLPPTSLPLLTDLSSSRGTREEIRIAQASEAELKRNLLQKIRDRKYAVNLFNKSNKKNQPTLKWVLNVEEFELKFPRALASLSLLVLLFWLIF